MLSDSYQLTNGTCCVRGCKEDPILCTNHKIFGLVATCAGHNPIKHGYAVALVRPTHVQAPAPQPRAQPRSTGGIKVPRMPKPIAPAPTTFAVCDNPF